MNTQNPEHTDLRGEIMEAIYKGRVRMRPRWHFLLFSAFGIVGSLIVFLTVLYIVSLAVFFMRESGALFAPAFGGRGWWALLHSLPWMLIFLVVVFVVLLQTLVRRYRFVYQKPLVLSALLIICTVVIGGSLLARASFHREFTRSIERGALPPPMDTWYRFVRPPHNPDLYRGKIVTFTKEGFVVFDEEGAGTTTVYITPHTRLPYGADFSEGTFVFIVGDAMGTDTVRAFGVRAIDQ